MAHFTENENPDKAKKLMQSFAQRTGLRPEGGNEANRYLWTDAFAVQTLFGLYHIFRDENYKQDALNLIRLVHEHLGKFHPKDDRKGWISGLPEEEGRKHPTSGGLRIGKKLPERGKEEAFNQRLEWERDGQYFHYITRWIYALLQAGRETTKLQYVTWAAELLKAAGNFIDDTGRRMYWKMSTDLSRPLVRSMGAHDPLEGLICALSIRENLPEVSPQIQSLTNKFTKLCEQQNWATTDALGIGGLLLSTIKAYGLKDQSLLPNSAKPENLFDESLYSIEAYSRTKEIHLPAHQRLAFRECGLSLGLRCLNSLKELKYNHDFKEAEKHFYLAREIEEFWKKPENQEVSTWKGHLNINALSLAASLTAKFHPQAF